MSLTPISAVRMPFSMFSLFDAAFCCMAAGLGTSLLQLNPINSVAGAALGGQSVPVPWSAVFRSPEV